MSNSMRFLDAYNAVDKALRSRFGLKPSMPFVDCVRRAATVNSVVRRFEDELIDLGRLRNAIVHKSNSTMTIAEPHDDVTELLERIAAILVKPPLASTIAHKAKTVNVNTPIHDVISVMADRNYSNLPVVSGNKIVGVITNKTIVCFLAHCLDGADEAIRVSTAGDVVDDSGEYYAIVGDCTVDEVVGIFEKNRKLAMLIVTKRGTADSDIIGVLTVSDLVTISKMLEVY